MANYNFDNKSLTLSTSGSSQQTIIINSSSLYVADNLILPEFKLIDNQNINFVNNPEYVHVITAGAGSKFRNDIRIIGLKNNASSLGPIGIAYGTRPGWTGTEFIQGSYEIGFFNSRMHVWGGYPTSYGENGNGIVTFSNDRNFTNLSDFHNTFIWSPTNLAGFGRLIFRGSLGGATGGGNPARIDFSGANRIFIWGFYSTMPTTYVGFGTPLKESTVRINNNVIVYNSLTANTSSQTLTNGVAINSSGSILPFANQNPNMSLGNSTYPWKNIWSQTAIQTSDGNLKTQISQSNLGLDFILDLKPVSYNFITDSKEKHYGLIAQDVLETLNNYGINTKDFAGFILDENGKMGLRYEEFLSPLIKAIQELSAKINALEKEIEARGL